MIQLICEAGLGVRAAHSQDPKLEVNTLLHAGCR